MNNTQIEKILKDYNVSTNNAYINAEQDWKNMLSDIDSYIQENYQPKPTSTDIEEIKGEFEKKFGIAPPIGQATSALNPSRFAFPLWPENIWYFFLPYITKTTPSQEEMKEALIALKIKEPKEYKTNPHCCLEDCAVCSYNAGRYDGEIMLIREINSKIDKILTQQSKEVEL